MSTNRRTQPPLGSGCVYRPESPPNLCGRGICGAMYWFDERTYQSCLTPPDQTGTGLPKTCLCVRNWHPGKGGLPRFDHELSNDQTEFIGGVPDFPGRHDGNNRGIVQKQLRASQSSLGPTPGRALQT